MQWFYLLALALTVTFAFVAKALWKTEQVLSVAALLTSLITFLWALTAAPAWGQLAMTAMLFALYRFPGFSLIRYNQYQISIK